jgi:hypothetical protein
LKTASESSGQQHADTLQENQDHRSWWLKSEGHKLWWSMHSEWFVEGMVPLIEGGWEISNGLMKRSISTKIQPYNFKIGRVMMPNMLYNAEV